MSHHSSLTVGLGARSYNIAVGRGLLDRIVDITDGMLAGRHVVIISDAAVAPHHLAPLEVACRTTARRCDSLTVASGEASKSMTVLARLLEDVLALGVDRDVILLSLIHI